MISQSPWRSFVKKIEDRGWRIEGSDAIFYPLSSILYLLFFRLHVREGEAPADEPVQRLAGRVLAGRPAGPVGVVERGELLEADRVGGQHILHPVLQRL